MNSVYTVDFLNKEPTSKAQATSFWWESLESHPGKSFDLFQTVTVAGLSLVLAFSPVTAISDPWSLEKRRRDAVVTVSPYKEMVGRFISRSEALRIARRILEQAEHERFAIAELESVQGIDWGNEA